MLFQDLGSRRVEADFSGGRLTSDGGALLLGQINNGLGISRKLATCFRDNRDPELIEHSVEQLLSQRLISLALGYEDLNDHADLRRDALLAAVVGKEDVLGEKRRCKKDRGAACASPATLNRLELGGNFQDRYRKIEADPEQVEATLLDLGVRCLPKNQKVFVLDFDATDTPLHGRREGRFFHGYYDTYCYLPLYCFCGPVVLWSQLRTSNRDASDGTVEALEKIVPAIRRRFPHARIVVRGDSGFCRESIMAWCEQNKVSYLLGMARNQRLEAMLTAANDRVAQRCCLTGVSCREYVEWTHRTLNSWSRSRRLLGKAERLLGEKSNPRFVVTNIEAEGLRDEDGEVLIDGAIRSLYEKDYCARGEAENMIKQMTLDLDSGRLSSSWMKANQMRVWFSAFAYLMLERLRVIGLAGSELAKANLGTVRLKLLKVAGQLKVSVRRVFVALNSTCGLKMVFQQAQSRLMALEAG